LTQLHRSAGLSRHAIKRLPDLINFPQAAPPCKHTAEGVFLGLKQAASRIFFTRFFEQAFAASINHYARDKRRKWRIIWYVLRSAALQMQL
jgi:hypothetical protein